MEKQQYFFVSHPFFLSLSPLDNPSAFSSCELRSFLVLAVGAKRGAQDHKEARPKGKPDYCFPKE
jgi:hypothetical protein